MADVIRIKKKKPVVAKAPKQVKPKDDSPRLTPQEVRVPNELQTLGNGLLWVGLAFVILLTLASLIILRIKHLPTAGAIIIIAMALFWVIGPFLGLFIRIAREKRKWEALLASSRLDFPATRQDPQRIVHEICRFLRLSREPTVALVPGAPAMLTVGQQIVVTDEFYEKTRDRDFIVLLVHEIAHQFLGHLTLLPYARAIPDTEDWPFWMRVILLPSVQGFRALEEWELFADISADRLILVMKPDLLLAILAIMKQVALIAPDNEERNNLIRFFGNADVMMERGQEVNISNQINNLLRSHGEAETRINNLRAYHESEGMQVAAQRLRDSVAALHREAQPHP